MTYKELAEKILALPVERQNDDVTISLDISEEALPATYFHCIQKDDMLDGVLDFGHPVIAINY